MYGHISMKLITITTHQGCTTLMIFQGHGFKGNITYKIFQKCTLPVEA